MVSILTAIEPIPEGSQATPGLWNSRYQQINSNYETIVGGGLISLASNLTGGFMHLEQGLAVGTFPPSEVTTAGITIAVNSNQSDYLYLVDSSGQRSDYIIGSRAGGTQDGLNIWDASGDTLIVSFSKDSIRFYQKVVGPVFDTGGALTNTLNAATFGTGADSRESRIQAAISAATASGISRVYIPASLYPYSAGSVVFSTAVQMVREGGDWSVNDLKAYGAYGDGVKDDRAALVAVDTALGQGFIPPGTYIIGSSLTLTGYWKSGYSAILKPGSNSTLYLSGIYEAARHVAFSGTSIIFNGGSAPFILPEWWGADPTGTISSTSALRSALTVVQNSSVRVLKFGAGCYLTKDLSITSTGVVLEGTGAGYQYNSWIASATTLRGLGGTTYIIDTMPNGGTSADPQLIQIRHLHLDGAETATNGIRGGIQTIIEDSSVQDCTDAGILFGQLTNAARLVRVGCVSNYDGLRVLFGTTYSAEECNFSLNANMGIDLRSGWLVNFSKCVIESNTGGGLYVLQPHQGSIGCVVFDTCWFEDNAANSIIIDAETRSEASSPFNIRFETCRINPSSNVRAYMNLISCKQVRFVHSFLEGSTLVGALSIQTSARLVSFEDCEFRGTAVVSQFSDAWEVKGATRMYRTAEDLFYTPTLINSYVSYGLGQQIPQFTHDLRGDVHLYGSMKSGKIGVSAFTLPVGFRSMTTRSYTVSSGGSVGTVEIRPSGAVVPSFGTGTSDNTLTHISLDGIFFSTATS